MEELTKEEMMNISGGLGLVDTARCLLLGLFAIKKIAEYLNERL